MPMIRMGQACTHISAVCHSGQSLLDGAKLRDESLRP